jgi:hypothetical protein
MKLKAQPYPRQDSQQTKDAQADRSRTETWPTRHPRVTASPACALMRQGQHPSDKAGTPLPQLAAPCMRRGESSMSKAGRACR